MSKRLCHFILGLVAAFAALTGLSSQALAQGQVVNPPDPYVHKGVGVEFPELAGEFVRGRVQEYNTDGTDASVGYDIDGLPGEITLYVYPAGEFSCQEHFDGAHAAIMQRGGKVKLSDAGMDISQFSGSKQLSRSYRIKSGGYGFDHPELVSYLWLACLPGDKWLVKYRGSFVASQADQVDGVADRLFSAIDWSAMMED